MLVSYLLDQLQTQAFAALLNASDVGIPTPGGGNDSGVVANILLTVYFWAGAIAVIIIIAAGFMYTTSGGDANKVTRAKNAIVGSVIGLVVIILAYAITNIVIGAL